jgi:hypothetical protein
VVENNRSNNNNQNNNPGVTQTGAGPQHPGAVLTPAAASPIRGRPTLLSIRSAIAAAEIFPRCRQGRAATQ